MVAFGKTPLMCHTYTELGIGKLPHQPKTNQAKREPSIQARKRPSQKGRSSKPTETPFRADPTAQTCSHHGVHHEHVGRGRLLRNGIGDPDLERFGKVEHQGLQLGRARRGETTAEEEAVKTVLDNTWSQWLARKGESSGGVGGQDR